MSLLLPSAPVARPGSAADVRAAIARCRAEGVRVRLDLRELRGVQVDPLRRIACVQGGGRWHELDAATQAHGLAVTGARVGQASVVASVLGGGSGWLERRMGLTADALRGARVMTADGEVVCASAREHPELLWALRGGGSAPGVVLDLELALRPLGPAVLTGALVWPLARAGAVGRAYSDLMAEAPDALGGGLWLARGHDGRPAVAVVVLYTGESDRGAAHLAGLRALGPVTDTVVETSYAALQALGGTVLLDGLRRDQRAGTLHELTDAVLDEALDAAAHAPGGASGVLLSPLGGAFARVEAGDTAAGGRTAQWGWRALAQWADPADEPAHRAWIAGLARALGCHAERRGEPERAARLAAVRAVYDPEGVFPGSNPPASPAAA